MSLEADWGELQDKSELDSVFLSHGLLRCFWDTWGSGKQLLVLLVHQRTRLLGTAPLMLHKSQRLGLTVRVLSFIENDETPHCEFLVDREANIKDISGLTENRLIAG